MAQTRSLALIAAGLIGAFAVIPHLLEHFAQFLGTGVLLVIAVAAGTWLAPRIALGTPVIDAALTGHRLSGHALGSGALGFGLGVLSAGAVVALDVLVFGPLGPRTQIMAVVSTPPLWTAGLAALYGGLTEEILLRFGAMSLLAWLLTKAVSGPAAYWTAIIGAAVGFGLWHLPAIAALLPLTPLVVTRALVLNGLAGVAFGWLYWRRGLEAAMVAHGVAASILHLTVPAIGV